jgi:hypothetical protein
MGGMGDGSSDSNNGGGINRGSRDKCGNSNGKVKSKGLRHVNRDVYFIAEAGRPEGKCSDTVL